MRGQWLERWHGAAEGEHDGAGGEDVTEQFVDQLNAANPCQF